ncbi:hypothetical protein KQY30_18535 [Streptomyces sp. GMY02]|uniref:RipA family octameric membrane protein n=1 Tax=Streptomyces sp. GMY02 TaxID=1333528 RepID=UPI001C2B7D06|nr:hypothetical protein [Streptomyces sp. GMY02]QXE35961.1 hypothetical protein KQY30_18535 [Streptomyces sp. GMY02]
MTPDSDPDRRAEVLELYKLAVEMADRVSARRGTANGFFLSVQTAFVALVAIGFPELADSPWWAPLAMALAGITLSATWWLQLRSYRDVNAAKFRSINKMEEHLPVKIFADEWEALTTDPVTGRRNHYAQLGASERIVPLVFAAVHVLLFAGTLSV